MLENVPLINPSVKHEIFNFQNVNNIEMTCYGRSKKKSTKAKNEDAFWISDNILCVVDGVSQWGTWGFDVSAFVNKFITQLKTSYETYIKLNQPNVHFIEFVYEFQNTFVNNNDVGFGALCYSIIIFSSSEKKIYIFSVGDVCAMLLRESEIRARKKFTVCRRTRPRMIRDNIPFQITKIPSIDKDIQVGHPAYDIINDFSKQNIAINKLLDIDIQEFSLEKNDVLVLASDGVYDNLQDLEIVEIVNKYNSNVKSIANQILQSSFEFSESPIRKYSKPDDITVVVSVFK